jgi:zinc transport system substrate-binding protein
MKNTVYILFFIFFSSTFIESKELNIVVTILPQKYFVEKIGGNLLNVTVMVEKGNDPHTYEPKTSKMIALSKADIYFTISLPLEKKWIDKMRGSNKKLKVIPMDKGIEKIFSESYLDNNNENSLHEDSHTWLSPALVRIMAENIRDALMKEDTTHNISYYRNFLNFIKEINRVDTKIADIFLNSKNDKHMFMVYHPSFSYFAKSYGLKQIAIEAEGKEPSPKRLISTIKTAKENDIKIIFVEPQFDKKSARSIAQSINAKLVEIDPLSYFWEDNLLKFAESIANNE